MARFVVHHRTARGMLAAFALLAACTVPGFANGESMMSVTCRFRAAASCFQYSTCGFFRNDHSPGAPTTSGDCTLMIPSVRHSRDAPREEIRIPPAAAGLLAQTHLCVTGSRDYQCCV